MTHRKMNPAVSKVDDVEKIIGPAWLIYMMKIAATMQHKDEALRSATIPLIKEFRKDGDIKPIIRAACEVLGDDFLDTVDWESDHLRQLHACLASRRARMMIAQARELVKKALK